MSEVTRVYAGRLAGMVVRGPETDVIGRVRDVVVNVRPAGHQSRVLGLVVEMTNKRRIFLPMLRIASIDPHEIMLVSGSVSLRAFKPRTGELTIMGDIIGAKVQVDDPDLPKIHAKPVEVADIEIERTRTRDWAISAVAVISERAKFGRRTEILIASWRHVHGITAAGVGISDAAAELLAEFEDMRPAQCLRFLTVPLDGPRSFLEECPRGARRQARWQHYAAAIREARIKRWQRRRAAEILEEMDPDDAADLLFELDDQKADVLLELMDPEESAPVRRLMSFSPDTVGALMTTEPLILDAQTTVAEALAHAANPDLPTSLASMVFVARPPTATPTGKFLGCVHLQKLLRVPPSTLVSAALDPELPPLYADDSQETAARYFATYNLVCGPVIDNDGHLLGAVAVDDLLDHLLPDDWRDTGIRPRGEEK